MGQRNIIVRTLVPVLAVGALTFSLARVHAGETPVQMAAALPRPANTATARAARSVETAAPTAPLNPTPAAPLTVSAPAKAAVSWGRVSGETVNIRSAPGTQSEIITTLNAGAFVKARANHGVWLEIEWPQNVPAYVSSQSLQLGSDGTATVKITSATLRAKGTSRAPELCKLAKDSAVTVLGEENGWAKVKAPENTRAYIHGRYVTLGVQPPTAAPVVTSPAAEKLIAAVPGKNDKSEPAVPKPAAPPIDLSANIAAMRQKLQDSAPNLSVFGSIEPLDQASLGLPETLLVKPEDDPAFYGDRFNPPENVELAAQRSAQARKDAAEQAAQAKLSAEKKAAAEKETARSAAEIKSKAEAVAAAKAKADSEAKPQPAAMKVSDGRGGEFYDPASGAKPAAAPILLEEPASAPQVLPAATAKLPEPIAGPVSKVAPVSTAPVAPTLRDDIDDVPKYIAQTDIERRVKSKFILPARAPRAAAPLAEITEIIEDEVAAPVAPAAQPATPAMTKQPAAPAPAAPKATSQAVPGLPAPTGAAPAAHRLENFAAVKAFGTGADACVAEGVLERRALSPVDGANFALVRDGLTLHYLKAGNGVDLEGYVGRRVSVTGAALQGLALTNSVLEVKSVTARE